MNKPPCDHRALAYWQEGTVVYPAKLTPDGDVSVDWGMGEMTSNIIDTGVFCWLCDEPIRAGEHGLREDWEVR